MGTAPAAPESPEQSKSVAIYKSNRRRLLIGIAAVRDSLAASVAGVVSAAGKVQREIASGLRAGRSNDEKKTADTDV